MSLQTGGQRASVTSVIDGDTFSANNTEGEDLGRLRVLGIDAPEMARDGGPGECHAVEATEAAMQLLDDATVTIAHDPAQGDRDQYGRLLVYVDVAGDDFAQNMLDQGHARLYRDADGLGRQESYIGAEQSARERRAGLWGSCCMTTGSWSGPAWGTTASLAARAAGITGSSGIANAYRSDAFTRVVSKSLAARAAGITGSSGIANAYRSDAFTRVVSKSLAARAAGITGSSGIANAYRSHTLGIVGRSFAAQLVGTSGLDASHRNTAGITARSLLLGERYRASTLGAVSHLVGEGVPSELVDQVLGDETLSGNGSGNAWRLIEEGAPELAAAIDEQAQQLGVVWVDQPAVRNTLAGIVVGLVVSAFLVGYLAPPPLNGILCLLLGAGGVSVPGATERMDRWLDERAPGDDVQ